MSPEDLEYVLKVLTKARTIAPSRKECLRLARKKKLIGKTKKGLPKYKYFWQCAICKVWFRNENEMEVDHIEEIGPFSGDLLRHIERTFCDQSNLQCLCVADHQRKTSLYNSARTRWKRKPLKQGTRKTSASD